MTKAQRILERGMEDVSSEFIFSGTGYLSVRLRIPDSSVDAVSFRELYDTGNFKEVATLFQAHMDKTRSKYEKETDELAKAVFTAQESLAIKQANEFRLAFEQIKKTLKV
jgi:hypothetical protein